MDDLAVKLGFDRGDLSRWYSVTNKIILRQHGGSSLMRRYNSSLLAALTNIYPDFPWDPFRFGQVPRNYWSSIENQKKFVKELEGKFNIKEGDLDAWYKVTTKALVDNGASSLLKHHHGSTFALLKAIYPSFPWDPLRFGKVPRNFWASIENQRLFIESLGRKLGGKEGDREALYKLSNQNLIENGASRLLTRYNSSIFQMLSSIYPEYSWDPLKFSQVPKHYWLSMDNQKAFMDALGKKLGFSLGNLEPWYKVTNQVMVDNGGSRILAIYKSSIPSLLEKVYPQYLWESWKFPRRNESVLKDPEAVADILALLESHLSIKDPKAWYRVTDSQLRTFEGSRVFVKNRAALLDALRVRYPAERWDEELFQKRRESARKTS